MRKNKRKFALLLAAAMLVSSLTGCGSGGNEAGSGQSGETGRFTETELKLPEGVNYMQTMAKLEDGSIEILACNNDTNIYSILNSSDMGESWEETKLEELGDAYIAPAAIAPDGTAALFEVKEEGEDTFTYTLRLASKQGEMQQVDVQLLGRDDGRSSMLWQAAYDSQGNLFAIDTEGHLLQINPSDGSCSQPFDTNGVSPYYFSIAGNTLCAVYDDGVLLFDTTTGDALDGQGAMDDIVKNTEYASPLGYERGMPMVFAQSDDDSILIVNHEGIFKHILGGSVNEQLANGAMLSLNDPELVLVSVVMLDANNILVSAFTDSGDDKLLRYTYDAKVSAAPEKELHVYALEDSDLLRQAMTTFQKNNPNVQVELEIGTSEDDGVTTEDALKVLNTNIMAGKGPDVLILDGMPLDSYIEKGILADISDVVDEVDKEDGLFSNIKDAYRQEDGKQYVMPMRFYTSIVTGDEISVAAGSSLKTLADRVESLHKQGGTTYTCMPRRADDLLQELFCADSAAWKKKDGTVDADKLKDYLTQAKRIYDVDSFDADALPESSYWGSGEQTNGSAENTGILMGMTQIGFGTFTGMPQLQLLYSVQQQSKTTFGLMNAKSFTPYLLAGVTADGDTDTAKQFVKTLLSKETNGSSNGFPVNRAAYDAACKEVMAKTDTTLGMSMGEYGERISVDFVSLTQEQIDACTAMLEGLTESSITDRVIQDLVLEQGQKYLDGTQALDETVNEIQKKINLYLSE